MPFSISHLAQSLSDLPGYLTNGNTPQGVFAITGTGKSRNQAIGPTPYLRCALPYEVTVAHYFNDPALEGVEWDRTRYRNMLPRPWRDYVPIQEAYFAGKAGRFDILAHGTTVNPEYYRGLSFYPNSPTIGCLSAKEIWSRTDGKAVLSDQVSLLKAFLSTGRKTGFLVVVELDSKARPVSLDEVIMDMLDAESGG
jgi:hypothetical protein